jgi:hypothetical protein
VEWSLAVLIALVGAVLVTAAVWFSANRIDRLHRRVEAAWASLHLQLTRRASMALVLAHGGIWEADQARDVRVAARAALTAPPAGPEHSELSAALRRAFEDNPAPRDPDEPPVARPADSGATATPRPAAAGPGTAGSGAEPDGPLHRAPPGAADPEGAGDGRGPDGIGQPGLVRDLGAIWYRCILARRFLNDAVSLARRLRSRRLVRLFGLAGRTPMPLSCDIDDDPPETLPLL